VNEKEAKGVGSVSTVKGVALVAVTSLTVTLMVPVLAPAGTDVVMEVAVEAVTVASTVPNFTVF